MPSAVVHPGALAAGTLPRYNTISKLLSETFLNLIRIERDIMKNVYWFSCKVPDILVRF